MRLLLFGGQGQLGLEIYKRARDLSFEVAAPVAKEVDVTDYDQVSYLVNRLNPEIVINAAAYTAVEQAETETEKAFAVNHQGVANIALAAKAAGARVFHISTDYVFAGDKGAAYLESDETLPINVYGKSKLAGEAAALEIMPDNCLIVRTSSLHGQAGNNFVHTMLKLFAERDEVKVVSDQHITVAWAGWLAEVLLDLARIDCQGVIHAAGRGVTTWYEFAKTIYDLSKDHNPSLNKNLKITPISASEFAGKVQRPVYSALDCSLLEKLLGAPPLTWQQGLEQHLTEIDYGNSL